MADIILAILLIIAGLFALGFAFLTFAAAGMGNPDDPTAPLLISLLLAIAGIGSGIAILVF